MLPRLLSSGDAKQRRSWWSQLVVRAWLEVVGAAGKLHCDRLALIYEYVLPTYHVGRDPNVICDITSSNLYLSHKVPSSPSSASDVAQVNAADVTREAGRVPGPKAVYLLQCVILGRDDATLDCGLAILSGRVAIVDLCADCCPRPRFVSGPD